MAGKLTENIVNLSLPDKIDNMSQRIFQLESRFSDMGYDVRNLVQT